MVQDLAASNLDLVREPQLLIFNFDKDPLMKVKDCQIGGVSQSVGIDLQEPNFVRHHSVVNSVRQNVNMSAGVDQKMLLTGLSGK